MANKIGGKLTKIDGYQVRLPKSGLSATQKQAISDRISNPRGLSKKDSCVLIAFPKGSVAQRCNGRSLAASLKKHKPSAEQKAARSRFGKAAKSCKGKGKGIAKCVKGKL